MNLRTRIDRNDDAFGTPLSGNIVPAGPVPVPQAIPVNNPQIITATPNSPISSPLQNNYILQNNDIGPQLGSSPPGGIINTPSVFSNSPNVRLFSYLFRLCGFAVPAASSPCNFRFIVFVVSDFIFW